MAEEDVLMREVNDALRHDQMMAMWRRYRTPLLAAAIALIVATGGSSLWQDYKAQRSGATMALVVAARTQYEMGAFNEAAKEFAAAADSAMSGDARDMAHLWQARALANSAHKAEAIALFDSVANHPAGADPIWRDLACLRLVGLDATKDDCLKAGDSPLKSQRDLLRAAALWQQGKGAEAAALLKGIVESDEISQQTRALAEQYSAAVAAAPAAKE